MTRTVPARHLFIPDPDMPPDVNGVRWCHACPLSERHEVHRLPDLPDVADLDARRTGEKE